MAGVQQLLHGVEAIAFFALRHIVARIDQIVDDAARVGPHAKQIVVLEEAVVPIGRVSNHQGLHGRAVLLHQIADARVGIDDDLIGQSHMTAR
jgi:hypothetical protein